MGGLLVPKYAPNKRKTSRRLGEHYSEKSYARAIRDACKDHDIPGWTPNQLRHARATEIERLYDFETAREALGHAKNSRIPLQGMVC